MIHRRSVLLCGPSRNAVSGVATHLNQLLHSAVAESYSLHHFQIGSEGRKESYLQKVIRFVSSPISLVMCVLQRQPDIVHLNTSLVMKAYWRDLVYMLVSKALGCRIVYQVHGGKLPSQFFGNTRLAQSFLRWSLGIPDVLVVLATAEHDAYRRFLRHRRIEIIPNAVDLSSYRGTGPKRFDRQDIQLGYLGRLTVEKGIREAISAVGSLRRKGLNFLNLRIAGTGPDERVLRELVEREGLTDCVQFEGAVFGAEKIRFWREIDVFVFPTYREGLPYVVLEALASGTPVITTRVGGIPDVIQNGVQGVFVEPYSSQSVADAIEGLVGQRALLRQMSGAGIQRAKEQYGVERLANQIGRLYGDVLRKCVA